tara:strand:- start:1601 stop:2821 length:1221 start_codon:yes stop_codon:yes gene_type:complete
MKKITILALLILATMGFNSCESNDRLEFIAQAPEEFTFSNSFLNEYILTTAASGNLGERFTWNDANFDVPTIVTYELQKSITGDFSDMEVVGSTTANELSVTIGDLLNYARDAGLDNDPATEAPNTGNVSFRVRAYVGDSGPEILSPIQMLTLVLPEDTGANDPVCDLDQLWLVGAGVPDAGWGWSTPVAITCNGDGIYSGNIKLDIDNVATPDDLEGNFRFFTSEDDWNSGQNYPYFIDQGYTIDSNFEDANDGDNNFLFVGTPGYYYLEVDTVNKTISLGEPQSIGGCEYDQLWMVGSGVPDAGWGWSTPVKIVCNGNGVYTNYVTFDIDDAATPDDLEGNFRFFTVEGDWNSGLNYPYFTGEGYTIDTNFEDANDGDNNFLFVGTPGTYFLTVDTVNKTITLE